MPLVAALILLAAATGIGVAITQWTHTAPGPSRAPAVREIRGLHAIATADASGYALFTTAGTVRFLPGVDLGATIPGHQPGELAITVADYTRWFDQMGRLGIHAVRIYTIHPPDFYRALRGYDTAHPTDPIYLVQGVYLPNDVYLQKQNLYDPQATETFRQELRDAVSAVSGKLIRPPRPGFASGTWTADLSRWTAGWVIGVEWDPYATAATDRANPHAPAVHGRYFASTPDATPTERWIAARMDDTASAEAAEGWTAPLAFANWPTTDPLRHLNEPNPQEDMVGVDASHVLPTRNWPGGTFASFHVYPYYPDFLQYQPSLQTYLRAGRVDPYAGYLHDLLAHFKGVMPVMITEFGVPSSLGSAHNAPLGRTQGEHSEQDSMRTDAQLLLMMRQLGMAGAFVFEWTDEWYKKTWNTQLHQIPLDRLQLWHDTFTNEQYFGVLATDPVPFGPPQTIYRNPGATTVQQVTATLDASFIHLAVTFARPPSTGITLGLDTVPTRATTPPPGSTDRHAAYAVVLDPLHHTGQTWVRDELDPDQVDYAPIPDDARPAAQDGWRPLELVTDRPWTLPLTHVSTRMQFDNVGLLRYGDWAPDAPNYDSLALWHLTGAELDLRIPWAMAGISDPSSHQALVPRGMNQATSRTVSDISLTVTDDAPTAQQAGALRWSDWQTVQYTERTKPAAAALHDAFTAVSTP
ncbi:hypothetical protein DN069_09445 [Streptacidiphilus pinicola]|uniref:Family 2 glycosyl transferase n=1 Tax=Streptacidiphilus pinicola TaxID=2219663 RepID=A0A2X0J605_9ACTN|nr:hypothetical protein DN069_09445 [Streptacidiphilus pinicola]